MKNNKDDDINQQPKVQGKQKVKKEIAKENKEKQETLQ